MRLILIGSQLLPQDWSSCNLIHTRVAQRLQSLIEARYPFSVAAFANARPGPYSCRRGTRRRQLPERGALSVARPKNLHLDLLFRQRPKPHPRAFAVVVDELNPSAF
jgi:hypothetical protein